MTKYTESEILTALLLLRLFIMLGQVVQLPDNKNNLDGMIFGSDTNIYYFTDFDHPDIFGIQVGDEIEFEDYPKNSNDNERKRKFLRHYVKIKSCSTPATSCICGHIYITPERNPENVSIYESIRNYEVCGESISREQALEEMIQTARTCGANAILGVTLFPIFNPIKRFLMYRYQGTMAQISADRPDSASNVQEHISSNEYKDESTQHNNEKTACRPIQIANSVIRKNSPNHTTKVRLQMMLLLFILFFLPLCGQLILNYSHIIPRYASFFFGLVTCIMIFVIYINLNPHKNCGYIKKIK